MRVPYPHVERPIMVSRPALVVSATIAGPANGLLWTIMITNAARADWPDDLNIPDAEALGLKIPSKLRLAKIAAVEARAATRLGRLPDKLLDEVKRYLRRTLDL